MRISDWSSDLCASDLGLGLNVDGPRPSTAGAPAPCAALRLIEVQMVAMGRIVIGRQDRRKQRAGAVADLMQEIRFLPLCLPVRRDADPTAIGQDETRHVDGVGGGMLAEIPGTASISAAAAIGHEMRAIGRASGR